MYVLAVPETCFLELPAGSDSGVLARLDWVASCESVAFGRAATGGRYVCPSNGVKLGRAFAAETNLSREVNMDSYLG